MSELLILSVWLSPASLQRNLISETRKERASPTFFLLSPQPRKDTPTKEVTVCKEEPTDFGSSENQPFRFFGQNTLAHEHCVTWKTLSLTEMMPVLFCLRQILSAEFLVVLSQNTEELSQDTEFKNMVITPGPFIVIHFDLNTLFSYIMFIYWS